MGDTGTTLQDPQFPFCCTVKYFSAIYVAYMYRPAAFRNILCFRAGHVLKLHRAESFWKS